MMAAANPISDISETKSACWNKLKFVFYLPKELFNFILLFKFRHVSIQASDAILNYIIVILKC